MEAKALNGNSSVIIKCPDEDSEMCITIKNKYKISYSLTLDEASYLANFIISHVINAREAELGIG